MTIPRHFDGKRFFNPRGARTRGFRDLLRWKFSAPAEPSPGFVADVIPSKPPERVEGPDIRVTLVNHSTILLQHGGVNILTDPIWSERASPLASAGPRRHRAPGVKLEDLPPIDAILLSHDHYDHLDLATLRWLRDHRPSQFVVPLGVAALLRKRSIGPVHELDWSDATLIAGLNIHAVPAMHFSARGLFDRNRTLWCGFVIQTPSIALYFAGDTGFGDHFSQIREQFGPPRLALLPIGSFEPRWFMAPVHLSPDEAVRAHEILGAKTSVAIHHGTFQLGNDAIDTPKQRLRACAPPSFLVLNNGESVTIS